MHTEDNTESHHILGPYHDFHDYSPWFRCIIQLHVSDLPDSRFHMYGFMESWNHLRVLCRTKLEVKRSRMSLRGLMVRSDPTVWTWCQAHDNVIAERTMLTTSPGLQFELVLKVDSALAHDYIKVYISIQLYGIKSMKYGI